MRTVDRRRRIRNGGWKPAVAVGVLIAAVALFLAPALFGGHIFTSAPLMYDYPPWQTFPPPDRAGNVNHLLSDNALQVVQWQHYARDALRSGHVPAWNPQALAGTPFLSNAQTALASPLYVPLWILPFEYSLGVLAALKLLIAAFGAYLLGRALGLGRPAAVLTGATYAFCAFNIVWLSHPHTNVSGLIPWTLWLVERAMRSGRRTDGLLVGLPVAVAFLSGHPGTQLHLLFAVGIYTAGRLIWPLGARPAAGRTVPAIAGGVALGVGAAAVVLLPALVASIDTAGQEVRAGGGFTIPLKALVTLPFPDFWGRPGGEVAGGPLNYAERTLNVGAIALVLAALAITNRDSLRRTAPLLALGAAGLLVAFGVEPFHWAISHLPLFDEVRNARMVLLGQLALSVVAGFGFERLMRAGPRDRGVWTVLAAAGIVVVVALVDLRPDLDTIRTTINHFRTGNDYPARPDVIQLTAVGWFALLSAGLGIVVALRRRVPSAWVAVLAVLLLLALDIGRFATGYQPMPAVTGPLPIDTPAIVSMRAEAGQGRVVAFTAEGFILPPDLAMSLRLRDVRGDDPPQPTLRYRRLWDHVEPRVPGANEGINLASLTPSGLHVLEVLGVRAVLTPTAPAPILTNAGLRLVHDESDARVYRDELAAPRALVPGRVIRADDESQSLATLTGRDFVPAHDAVVETDGPTPPAARGSVRIAVDEPERVDLQTELARGGLVVLGDAFDDGWSVEVDRRKAKPLRVNSVLRGVEVPAGDHTVSWTYRTPGLTAGAVISVLSVLLAVVIAFVLRARAVRLLASRTDDRNRPQDGGAARV